MSIEAMKQALNALEFNLPVIEDFGSKEQLTDCHRAITKLYAELAKPEQEPVNTMPTKIVGPNLENILNAAGFYKREWVGLTDDEMHKIIDDCTPDDAAQEELNDFARAIFDAQAKLKEKNT